MAFRRFVLCAFCVCCLCYSVSALDVPSSLSVEGSGFISVSGSALGSVDIFIAVSSLDGFLTLDSNGIPFNVTGSSVQGYVLSSSGDILYYVRWPSFGYAEYRSVSSSGYQYQPLNITGVSSSNVHWITYSELSGPSDDLWQYLIFGVLLMGVVVCFIKR